MARINLLRCLRSTCRIVNRERMSEMPKWTTIAIRVLGIINCLALLLGTSFLARPLYRVLFKNVLKGDRLLFSAMFLVELTLVTLLLGPSVQFIRGKSSAANLYSIAVLILIFFEVGTGMSARAGGIAVDIAVASAVVSSGTAPFEFLLLVPFLYPVLSVTLVQLAKRGTIYQSNSRLVR